MAAPEGKEPDPGPRLGLCGGYLLVIIAEPHTAAHKSVILSRIKSGLLSWNGSDCGVDLDSELSTVIDQALTGEVSKTGERLIQHASDTLVTEILVHPQLSTVAQCVRNLLASHTQHKHVVYAGYTFTGNGSWILQDGIFTLSNLISIFHEPEVRAVLSVTHEPPISLHIHAASEGDGEWSGHKLEREYFSRLCVVSVNPPATMSPGPAIEGFISYLDDLVAVQTVEDILPPTQIVGNIRFTHPTLYVFPGGHGDAALFGINGFNMLIDGGFGRKACFWDFIRHLDRVDAMLMTRINKTNVTSLANVVRRKKASNIHPQVGHFFCNLQDRKHVPTPDVDKDSLLIDVLLEGQEMISNLKAINLKPQPCYRDVNMEPINLYHKVGYGKLDMYVISPARDSREVKEFLMKWHSNDTKLFSAFNKKTTFPIQNLVSICALLVWQPANPNETITRLLFPGSAPQYKIFEGLEKIKHLEFLKYPVCTAKSLNTTIVSNRSSSKTRSLKSDAKAGDDLVTKTNKLIEDLTKENLLKPEITKDICNDENDVKKEEKERSRKAAPKKEVKARVDTKINKKKPTPGETKDAIKDATKEKENKESTKCSPTSPKKFIDSKMNGIIKASRVRNKSSPSSTPSKSAKEEVKKVTETKKSAAPRSTASRTKSTTRAKEEGKITSVPKKVARRPVDQKKDDKKANMKLEYIKNESGLTTDSSTVSTPSTADNAKELKEHVISKVTKEMYTITTTVPDKGQDTEEDEIMTIEKVESESAENEKDAQENEEQKEEKKQGEEEQIEIQDVEGKTALNLDLNLESKEEKEQTAEIKEAASVAFNVVKESTVKKTPGSELSSDEIGKGVQKDSDDKKDEKMISTVESGQTTTAPTLPEDERIPVDEIKAEKVNIVGKKIDLKKEAHISKIQSGIVKTPDEVADLPVHEEVDATDFEDIEKKEGIDEEMEEDEVVEEQDGSTDIMSTDIIKGSVSFITTTRESDDILNEIEDGEKTADKTEDEKITDEKGLEDSKETTEKEEKLTHDQSTNENKETNIMEEDKADCKRNLERGDSNISNVQSVNILSENDIGETKETEERIGVDNLKEEKVESKEAVIVEKPIYRDLKPDHAEYVTVTPDSSLPDSPKKTDETVIKESEVEAIKTSEFYEENQEQRSLEVVEEVSEVETKIEQKFMDIEEETSKFKENENEEPIEGGEESLINDKKIEHKDQKATEIIEETSKLVRNLEKEVDESIETSNPQKETGTSKDEDKEPVIEKLVASAEDKSQNPSSTPQESASLKALLNDNKDEKSIDKQVAEENSLPEKKLNEISIENIKTIEDQGVESTSDLVHDTKELTVTREITDSPGDSSILSPTKSRIRESKGDNDLKSLLAVNDSMIEKSVSISEKEIETSAISSEVSNSIEKLTLEKRSEKDMSSNNTETNVDFEQKSKIDSKEKDTGEKNSNIKGELSTDKVPKTELQEPSHTKNEDLDPTKYKYELEKGSETVIPTTILNSSSKKESSEKIIEDEQSSPPKSPFDRLDSRKTSTESLGNKSTTESILSAEQPEESDKEALTTSQERKSSRDDSILAETLKRESIKTDEEFKLGNKETSKLLLTAELEDESRTTTSLKSEGVQIEASKVSDVKSIEETKSSDSKIVEKEKAIVDSKSTEVQIDNDKCQKQTVILPEKYSEDKSIRGDDSSTELSEKKSPTKSPSKEAPTNPATILALSEKTSLEMGKLPSPTKSATEISPETVAKSTDPTNSLKDSTKLHSPTTSLAIESPTIPKSPTEKISEDLSSQFKLSPENVTTPPISPMEKSAGTTKLLEKDSDKDKNTINTEANISKETGELAKISNENVNTSTKSPIDSIDKQPSPPKSPAEKSKEIEEQTSPNSALEKLKDDSQETVDALIPPKSPVEKCSVIDKLPSPKKSPQKDSIDEEKQPLMSAVGKRAEEYKENRKDASPPIIPVGDVEKLHSPNKSLAEDSKEILKQTTPPKTAFEKLEDEFKEKDISSPKSPHDKCSEIDKLPSPKKSLPEDSKETKKQSASQNPALEKIEDISKENEKDATLPKSPAEKCSDIGKIPSPKKSPTEDSGGDAGKQTTQLSAIENHVDEFKENKKDTSSLESPAEKFSEIDEFPSPKISLSDDFKQAEKQTTPPKSASEKLQDEPKEKDTKPPRSPGEKSEEMDKLLSSNKSLPEDSQETEKETTPPKSEIEKLAKELEDTEKSSFTPNIITEKSPERDTIPKNPLPDEPKDIGKLASPPKSPTEKSTKLSSPSESIMKKSIEKEQHLSPTKSSLEAEKLPTKPKSPTEKFPSLAKSDEEKSKMTEKLEAPPQTRIEKFAVTDSLPSPKKSLADDSSIIGTVTQTPLSPTEKSNVEKLAGSPKSPKEKVPHPMKSPDPDSKDTDNLMEDKPPNNISADLKLTSEIFKEEQDKIKASPAEVSKEKTSTAVESSAEKDLKIVTPPKSPTTKSKESLSTPPKTPVTKSSDEKQCSPLKSPMKTTGEIEKNTSFPSLSNEAIEGKDGGPPSISPEKTCEEANLKTTLTSTTKKSPATEEHASPPKSPVDKSKEPNNISTFPKMSDLTTSLNDVQSSIIDKIVNGDVYAKMDSTPKPHIDSKSPDKIEATSKFKIPDASEQNEKLDQSAPVDDEKSLDSDGERTKTENSKHSSRNISNVLPNITNGISCSVAEVIQTVEDMSTKIIEEVEHVTKLDIDISESKEDRNIPIEKTDGAATSVVMTSLSRETTNMKTDRKTEVEIKAVDKSSTNESQSTSVNVELDQHKSNVEVAQGKLQVDIRRDSKSSPTISINGSPEKKDHSIVLRELSTEKTLSSTSSVKDEDSKKTTPALSPSISINGSPVKDIDKLTKEFSVEKLDDTKALTNGDVLLNGIKTEIDESKENLSQLKGVSVSETSPSSSRKSSTTDVKELGAQSTVTNEPDVKSSAHTVTLSATIETAPGNTEKTIQSKVTDSSGSNGALTTHTFQVTEALSSEKNVTVVKSEDSKNGNEEVVSKEEVTAVKETTPKVLEERSETPDAEMIRSRMMPMRTSYIGAGDSSRSETPDSRLDDMEDDTPMSPVSVTSSFSPPPELMLGGHVDNSVLDNMTTSVINPDMSASVMMSSFYGTLPGSDDNENIAFERALDEHRSVRGNDLLTDNATVMSTSMTTSINTMPQDSNGNANIRHNLNEQESAFIGQSMTTTQSTVPNDPIKDWGKPLGLPPPPSPRNKRILVWNPVEEWGRPLGLPSPVPLADNMDESCPDNINVELTPINDKLTPRKTGKKDISGKPKRPDSPGKYKLKDLAKRPPTGAVYVDLAYIPHHGHTSYTTSEFFKKIRARHYVFSGIEPSKQVFNALLEAKQTWEDKDLETTIIPTYDTETLGCWVTENEETLTKYKIDLSPSASRCTINLQDHETSCSAYRLEF